MKIRCVTIIASIVILLAGLAGCGGKVQLPLPHHSHTSVAIPSANPHRAKHDAERLWKASWKAVKGLKQTHTFTVAHKDNADWRVEGSDGNTYSLFLGVSYRGKYMGAEAAMRHLHVGQKVTAVVTPVTLSAGGASFYLWSVH